MWCSGTRASADSRRIVISVLLISSEKIALGRPFLTEAARAMSSPSVLLPRPGRPAMTMSWPGCRPLVSPSRSTKPVGTPDIDPPRLPIASSSSIVGCMSCSSSV
jgi:hypothetical protein